MTEIYIDWGDLVARKIRLAELVIELFNGGDPATLMPTYEYCLELLRQRGKPGIPGILDTVDDLAKANLIVQHELDHRAVYASVGIPAEIISFRVGGLSLMESTVHSTLLTPEALMIPDLMVRIEEIEPLHNIIDGKLG